MINFLKIFSNKLNIQLGFYFLCAVLDDYRCEQYIANYLVETFHVLPVDLDILNDEFMSLIRGFF